MTNLDVLQDMRAELSARLEAIDEAIAAMTDKTLEKKKGARSKKQAPLSDPAAGSLDFPRSGSGGIRLDL